VEKTGSACSSGSTQASHVLTAIGLDEKQANSSIRTTFGEENTKEDVDFLINNLERIVNEIRTDREKTI